MTNEDLIDIIDFDQAKGDGEKLAKALKAVLELHKPFSHRMPFCNECHNVLQGEASPVLYPCPTIQAIGKELA